MTRSFVLPGAGRQTLTSLPPSTREEIRVAARAAGLDLPETLMEELCNAFPAFEAMVRRLPRARALFDEPALTFNVERVAGDPEKAGAQSRKG